VLFVALPDTCVVPWFEFGRCCCCCRHRNPSHRRPRITLLSRQLDGTAFVSTRRKASAYQRGTFVATVWRGPCRTTLVEDISRAVHSMRFPTEVTGMAVAVARPARAAALPPHRVSNRHEPGIPAATARGSRVTSNSWSKCSRDRSQRSRRCAGSHGRASF